MILKMEERMVEVIKDGEIVKMSERQARMEDLFILREATVFEEPKQLAPLMPQIRQSPFRGQGGQRQQFSMDLPVKVAKPAKEVSQFEAWKRNKFDYKNNNVIQELKENFHWEISKTRRLKNISRARLAEAIGETEERIKIVEQGGLPEDNFFLINKIQNYLGINLRRDGKVMTDSPRAMLGSDVTLAQLQKVQESKPEVKKTEKAEDTGMKSLLGDDIEIIE